MAREYLGDLYNEPSLKSNTKVPSNSDLYSKLKTLKKENNEIVMKLMEIE